MDALVQFFTAVAVALAATALSHFGIGAEGVDLRSQDSHAERAVKRSPAPSAQIGVRSTLD
jgi:hypothetical protein